MLTACNGQIEASTTSACHTATCSNAKPVAPKVLVRSGIPEHEAVSTIRLSVGRDTTPQDIRRAAAILSEAYKALAAKTQNQ